MASVKGGEKLSAAIRKIAGELGKDATLKVGFFAGATEENGVPVPLVAFWNEFGKTVKGREEVTSSDSLSTRVKKSHSAALYYQLPRPFFRNMIAKNQNKWPGYLKTILKNNNYDIERSLKLLGERMADQLKESILDLTSPPLAPSTIARKGNDKPLIETHTMINSATYQVTLGKD